MKKQVECCGVLQIVSVGPWHHIDETWAWVYPQIIDQMCFFRMEHLMFTPHVPAFFNFPTLGTLYFKLEAVTQHGFHDPIHSVFLSWKMYHRLETTWNKHPKLNCRVETGNSGCRLREQDHVQSAMRLHIDLFLGLGSQLLESEN
jgi:hypothetical protein